MKIIELAPHLNHDTSMKHTIAICVVIAFIVLFLLYILNGGDKK